MKILAVAFSHHVLVDGQPRRLDPQLSGPCETELLQVQMVKMFRTRLHLELQLLI